MALKQLIQHRGDTAANWTSVNPILALREKGVETDTLKEKIGDGTTAWASLPYFNVSSAAIDATTTSKGVVKLANDLGGTADLPTTPTAVHLTGNETINGIKTFGNNIILPAVGNVAGMRGESAGNTHIYSIGRVASPVTASTSFSSLGAIGLKAGQTGNATSAFHVTILTSGNTGIGTDAPNSLFHTAGSFATALTSTATNLTLATTHQTVEVTAAVTITLPTAVGVTGRTYDVINTSAGSVTIATTSSQVVGNAAATSDSIPTGSSRTYISNGAAWRAK